MFLICKCRTIFNYGQTELLYKQTYNSFLWKGNRKMNDIRGKIDNLRINCDISVIDMKRNGYSDKERYRMG